MQISRLLKSIKYALKGILIVLKRERNFKIHLLAAIIVILLASMLHLGVLEVSILILAISMVLALEMVNSAIEYTWNKLEPNHHPVVGEIKDVMAGSVLIASIGAVIIGIVIIILKII